MWNKVEIETALKISLAVAKEATVWCHSVNLPLYDLQRCKLTTRVYPQAFDETANENGANRLFSAEKWNYCFQFERIFSRCFCFDWSFFWQFSIRRRECRHALIDSIWFIISRSVRLLLCNAMKGDPVIGIYTARANEFFVRSSSITCSMSETLCERLHFLNWLHSESI